MNLIRTLSISLGQEFRRQLMSNFEAIQRIHNLTVENFNKHKTTDKHAHQAKQIDYGRWTVEDELEYQSKQTANLVLGELQEGQQEYRDARVSVFEDKPTFLTVSERLKNDLLF